MPPLWLAPLAALCVLPVCIVIGVLVMMFSPLGENDKESENVET